MTLKRLVTLIVLSAIITLNPASAAYAVSGSIVAKPVPAVALSSPFWFTISVQSNNLVISGIAPSYHAKSVKIDIIKPVTYAISNVRADGVAVIEHDPSRDVTREPYYYTVQPIIVRTLTHTLDPLNSNMAQTKSTPDGLTVDLTTAPKIDISTLSDGIYNLRTGYVGDPAYDCLYSDEILIVIQNGKATLQLLPTYHRYITVAGATGYYSGYSLSRWVVQPAITPEAYVLWRKGL